MPVSSRLCRLNNTPLVCLSAHLLCSAVSNHSPVPQKQEISSPDVSTPAQQQCQKPPGLPPLATCKGQNNDTGKAAPLHSPSPTVACPPISAIQTNDVTLPASTQLLFEVDGLEVLRDADNLWQRLYQNSASLGSDERPGAPLRPMMYHMSLVDPEGEGHDVSYVIGGP
jgi:hypothetical protein